MERAGIDIITDGEMRRESYSNRFATALDGVDIDNPATITGRAASRAGCRGSWADPPPASGRGARRRVPAPQHRPDDQDHAARAVHDVAPGQERVLRRRGRARDGFRRGGQRGGPRPQAAGADIIQLDEPWIETAPELAARYALQAIDRALAGVPGPTALHLCFGYAQLVHDKSRGRYAFLEPLADSAADQISIEAAQPKLDLGVLRASRARPSSSASSTSATRRSSRPSRWPRGSAAGSSTCRRSG